MVMFMENEEHRKFNFKWIIPYISLVLSIIAFVFSTFPQTNPFNTNPLEKANAGHSKSQMFLAHHYYEIGDIEESYYWYKIASTTNGKYQAAALNNLAYIELTYLKTNDTEINYLDKSLKVLDNAIELGDKTALENQYILLIANNEKFFKGINYYSKIDNIEKQMTANDMNVSKYAKFKGDWEYIETCTNADSIPPNTNEYRFIGTGADHVRSNDNAGLKWIYTYDVYRLNKEVLLPEFKYIDFN